MAAVRAGGGEAPPLAPSVLERFSVLGCCAASGWNLSFKLSKKPPRPPVGASTAFEGSAKIQYPAYAHKLLMPAVLLVADMRRITVSRKHA